MEIGDKVKLVDKTSTSLLGFNIGDEVKITDYNITTGNYCIQREDCLTGYANKKDLEYIGAIDTSNTTCIFYSDPCIKTSEIISKMQDLIVYLAMRNKFNNHHQFIIEKILEELDIDEMDLHE